MKVLITGGNGYIGKNIYKKFKDEHDIYCLTREDVDLTDSMGVFNWFGSRSFDVVIHTAVVGGRRTKVQNSGKPTPSEVEVLDQNLLMYYNLLKCGSFYDRLIQLGSGAERFATSEDPYAISKFIINKSISGKDNFYNVRIFATFDENEQDDRFIKSNLMRYIRREPMILHSNKKMDFFYMEDLISVVGYYISEDNPPKNLDCVYKDKKTLLDIANIINSLADYRVDIQLEERDAQDYCGEYSDVGLEYLGLEGAINKIFKNEKLKIFPKTKKAP